jgi:hypothetical protein
MIRDKRGRKEKERRENVIHEVGALCEKRVGLGLSEIKPAETMPRKPTIHGRKHVRVYFYRLITSDTICLTVSLTINVQMRRDRIFSDGVLTPQPRGFELIEHGRRRELHG